MPKHLKTIPESEYESKFEEAIPERIKLRRQKKSDQEN